MTETNTEQKSENSEKLSASLDQIQSFLGKHELTTTERPLLHGLAIEPVQDEDKVGVRLTTSAFAQNDGATWDRITLTDGTEPKFESAFTLVGDKPEWTEVNKPWNGPQKERTADTILQALKEEYAPETVAAPEVPHESLARRIARKALRR